MSTTSGTAPGSYPLTITGSGGGKTHTASVTLVVTDPDFSLSATPPSQTVLHGNATSYTVNLARTFGFTSTPVALSVSGLPSGATATGWPTSTTGTSATLPISTNASTAPGSYPLTITGTGGGKTHSTSVTLEVTAPDYTLTASPSSRSVAQGDPAVYTVTINRTGGFTAGVTLSVSGGPGGATYSFSPANPQTGGSATLTVSTSVSTMPGKFTVTITGTGGGLPARTTTVSLEVRLPCDQGDCSSDG
jgi:hypothetical protein